jgi:spore germination protein
VVETGQVRLGVQSDDLVEAVLRGDVLVGLADLPGALVISLRGAKGRGVEDPLIEVVAPGPRDAFTETARDNVALIRRRLPDPNLRVQRLMAGERSRTYVYLLYLEDVVNRTALEELRRRVEAVQIDGILDTSMLEQLIEDCWWSPFPQAETTERPDVAAAALLEGRLCLVVDNSPLVLIAPTNLTALFHTPEDIYGRPTTVTLLRVVRFLAAVIGLTLPALYVSVAAFNPGLLPVRLAIKIANSREGVALPVVAEALLMQFFLETLREAGFRLPGPIGQTFGIVGGIVLGELGVRAGLVSEVMVVVIALTAIASFATPSLLLGTSIRLLGLPLMLAAAALGIYGLVLAFAALLAHLVTLRSLGVPYLVPYPFYPAADFQDVILRAPLAATESRPSVFGPQQRRRAADARRDRFHPAAGRVHEGRNGAGGGKPR